MVGWALTVVITVAVVLLVHTWVRITTEGRVTISCCLMGMTVLHPSRGLRCCSDFTAGSRSIPDRAGRPFFNGCSWCKSRGASLVLELRRLTGQLGVPFLDLVIIIGDRVDVEGFRALAFLADNLGILRFLLR